MMITLKDGWEHAWEQGDAKSLIDNTSKYGNRRCCERGCFGCASEWRRRRQSVCSDEFCDARPVLALALAQRRALALALPSVQSLALLVRLLTEKIIQQKASSRPHCGRL
jgi:hypothetical protein